MRRAHMALVLVLLLPAAALCRRTSHPHHQDDEEDGQQQEQHGQHEHKDVSESNGHSLVIDLSSLSVLAALKLKFVVVLLIAFAVFLLISKGYKTQCLFGNCRPSYSTYGYYPYVDYSYVGYEVPAAASSPTYRRPSSASPPQLSDLTARVWNSIDLAGMAFSALNIEEDDCRRKLVCQADRAASTNPLLRAALSWFSASLARYRTDRSRVGAESGAQWRQEDPCEEMYPQCVHRDLPPALGGPTAPQRVPERVPGRPYLYQDLLGATSSEEDDNVHLQQHLQQQHLQSQLRPSQEVTWLRPPYDYRNAFPFEYPQRYPAPVAEVEALDIAAAVASHQDASTTPEGAVIAAAASPSASTVLAPVRVDGPGGPGGPGPATAHPAVPEVAALSTPPTTPQVPGRTMGAAPGALWDSGNGPPQPRTSLAAMRAPASNATDTPPISPPPTPPSVWRRYRFGNSVTNRTKRHID